jgi:hypothetical protein
METTSPNLVYEIPPKILSGLTYHAFSMCHTISLRSASWSRSVVLGCCCRAGYDGGVLQRFAVVLLSLPIVCLTDDVFLAFSSSKALVAIVVRSMRLALTIETVNNGRFCYDWNAQRPGFIGGSMKMGIWDS